MGAAKGTVGAAILDELFDAASGFGPHNRAVAGAAVADGDNGRVFAPIDALVVEYLAAFGEYKRVHDVVACIECSMGLVAGT